MTEKAKATIEAGKAILGIEFGSTRIKAVLIDESNNPIAQGSHEWENKLVNGFWTYSLEEIWFGVQDCYRDLRAKRAGSLQRGASAARRNRRQRYDARLHAV